MATADQLKALLRSYVEGDRDRFLTVSMQVAAHAARRGNTNLAQQLRELIDEAKRQSVPSPSLASVPIARPIGELADLVAASYPKTRLVDMVLAEPARKSLERVMVEYRQQAKLRSHGLSARRKLLLVGPPGCGKTMTASALAGELNLPLLSVRLDGLITKYLGESAAKLRQVPEQEGTHYSDLFEQYLSVHDKPRRLLADWLPQYFIKTASGTWRIPDQEEGKQLAKLREAGTLRRIKRFANALIDGVPVRDKDRPGSDADLLDWLRQCRRAGLYEQGKAIYEKGGLNLAKGTS
ncbi:MAG: AAA family ATPase [Planctomycetaceae bacterium]|nr:MAG: AAA family ATPase [Planctomycetaceae bacterium]